MPPEDQIRLEQMEKDIRHLSEQMDETAGKVDLILHALKGDDLSGNNGLSARVLSLEKDVKDLREERVKNTIYVRIITWLLGIIATGIVGYILSLIFTKSPHK